MTPTPVDLSPTLREILETDVTVPAFLAWLAPRQIVVQNAKLIGIVPMTKHARTKNALIPALVYVATMQNVELETTSQYVFALRAILGILLLIAMLQLVSRQ